MKNLSAHALEKNIAKKGVRKGMPLRTPFFAVNLNHGLSNSNN